MIHLRLRRPLAAGTLFAACVMTAACQHAGPAPAPQPPRPSAVGAPAAGLVNRQVNTLTTFSSPTGEVGCRLDASAARCDITERNWAPPLRPAGCAFDYGRGISVQRGQPARFVCAGDTAMGGGAALGYGDSISAGALQCETTGAGITCRDTETAHGFALSPQAYRLF